MITIEDLIREVEDSYRHGYGVGYAEGFSRGKDPNSIERGTFLAVLQHKMDELRKKYQQQEKQTDGTEELGHS